MAAAWRGTGMANGTAGRVAVQQDGHSCKKRVPAQQMATAGGRSLKETLAWQMAQPERAARQNGRSWDEEPARQMAQPVGQQYSRMAAANSSSCAGYVCSYKLLRYEYKN